MHGHMTAKYSKKKTPDDGQRNCPKTGRVSFQE